MPFYDGATHESRLMYGKCKKFMAPQATTHKLSPATRQIPGRVANWS